MKIATIIIFIIILFFFLLVMMGIVYNMAKVMCNKSEVKPVRYEYVGIFGSKIPVITTPGNEDEYAKVCVYTGKPTFFGLTENIKYIVNQTNTGAAVE